MPINKRAGRDTRPSAAQPASSAGSHDTISPDATSLGAPKKEVTMDSILSDITNLSYISPANVGFEPSVPLVRPAAPTPGISANLPSSRAPSSCDFGTQRSLKFNFTPTFGPSPPDVQKTRDRNRLQARCDTAPPSEDSLHRFFRGFSSTTSSYLGRRPTVRMSTADACDGELSAMTTPNATTKSTPPSVCSPSARSVRAPSVCAQDPPTIDLSVPYPPKTRAPSVPTRSDETSNMGTADGDSSSPIAPPAVDAAAIDAFTTWSLFALGDNLADFVSGSLKFCQIGKDGNPVFEKTCTGGISSKQISNKVKGIGAVHLPKEENRIFVSMDQLRHEIAELQEHDEAMEREADKLHQDKARLELQLQDVRGTCRKSSSDSAIGSDSESDIRKRVQADKLKRMQQRLDEANALINAHEVRINALTAERDELAHDCRIAYEEAAVLKKEVHKAGEYFFSIEKEVERFKAENERLRQQNQYLSGQNNTLRQTRKAHSEQIKNLHTELDATRTQLGETTQQLQKKDRTLRQTRQAHSSQVEDLQTQLAATRAQLGETEKDSQLLLRQNKEIKNQRDELEQSLESLQEEFTVIRRQLRDSTNNSISSQRKPTNEDMTTRPAADPAYNMRVLISALESEINDVQRRLEAKAAEFNAMNKGYGRRSWQRLHEEKVALERKLHEKSELLYAQYDVLEHMKQNGRM